VKVAPPQAQSWLNSPENNRTATNGGYPGAHLATLEFKETAVTSQSTVARRASALLLTLLGLVPLGGHARPLSSEVRGRLAAGQPTTVIVEFDGTAVDRAAVAERARRGLRRDDAAILALRSQGYAATRASVVAGVGGVDATSIHDYQHFPLAVWRLSSINALNHLLAYPGVRAVHENVQLHPVSVSDLPFINQPQAASEGATGNGTTIAVIDGGLGANYLNFSDFGTCTGVGTPASTCRVVFNWDFYSGTKASQETVHGTNVSAIALGVAPGAKLAMFDVFQGTSASSADLNTALDTIIQDQATYNIVAISMSLGDGTSNTSQCGGPGQSPFTTSISNALAAGIAVVVAAGNSGSKTGLSDPACVPGVISVGAVYDNSYGTVTWGAPADSGGQCSDATAPDHVTCFSQSASYLSILAPGSFVNAPTSAFQQSGTSQATPHISGAVAVLRARYAAETLTETLKRMQVSGVSDTDSANGRTTPRLNLVAAVNQGTSLSLSGGGPSTATSGGNATYTITVTNSGPLDASTVKLTDTLPAGATFTSASAGCTFASSRVTCNLGNLAANASTTITINVTWNSSGPVYDTAVVTADQVNTSSQPTISFGTAIVADEDAPLPIWAYGLLGIAVLALGRRQLDASRS
jgi:uncharacterized repeat protein (TIGR01451 family)